MIHCRLVWLACLVLVCRTHCFARACLMLSLLTKRHKSLNRYVHSCLVVRIFGSWVHSFDNCDNSLHETDWFCRLQAPPATRACCSDLAEVTCHALLGTKPLSVFTTACALSLEHELHVGCVDASAFHTRVCALLWLYLLSRG